MLANPRGDLRKYKNTKGEQVYYHTGLPSIWTVGHFVGLMGKNNQFYMGKLTAAEIPGQEYTKVDVDYKFQEKKLWEMIRK